GAAVVVGQAYVFDMPDLYAVDLDRCVAGLQAFGRGQLQRHFGAAAEKILVHQPATDEHGCQRNQPDRGNARAAANGRLCIVVCSHGFGCPGSRHNRRRSKVSAAIMVMTTTPAKETMAGPGVMPISGPACTSAVSMATTNTSIIDQRPMIS